MGHLEWNVLYTSQIMKKAKTYHDGILRVDVRGNHAKQAVLYDIDRRQLDKKLIKKDEIVECGQSFKFDAHLVEIGDPLEDSNLLDALNSSHGNCMKEFTEVPKASTITTGFQNDVSKKRSIASDPNFSHQVIKEWNVLYTSQILKKAKTYHDGILRLDVRGNDSNQVILYDIDKKPLDKKLVKKDEIIECGQSFKFDGHLVDIGEHLEASNSLDGLNSRHGNCMKEFAEVPKGDKTVTTEPQHGDWMDGPVGSDLSAGEYKLEHKLGCLKPVRSEWNVLYTSQIMKKAKTYHDGILRVDVRGNHAKQAVLYDIDRRQLDKKLITKDEIVECGQSFKFDAHLVEIGDPLEDSNLLDALNSSHENCMKEFAEVPKASTITTGFQNDVSKKRSIASDPNFSHQVIKEPQHGAWMDGPVGSDLSAGEYKLEHKLGCLKPVRSVCQILQSLKKPMDPDSAAATGVDTIIIQVDPQMSKDTVEKIVEQKYAIVKPDFDLKAANLMEINIRTTECSHDEGIDAMMVIQQTSPTSIEPGQKDSILKGSGDCCKPDLGSPLELEPHLNENSENIADCPPSFNLLF